MKKALLLMALSTPLFLQAQSLQNTNFENWNIASYNDLSTWMTSNEYSIPLVGIPNVTQVNPGVTNSAVRLETVANATDTMVGFISNSDDPISGDGGFPFSQKPTGLSGSFRYNIMANDTARIFIAYKNTGVIFAADTVSVWGSQGSFTLNNFPLPGITSSSITPDTVIIAITSSDFINETFVAGSWIEIDNMAFTGPGITQGINGDFDTWVSKSLVDLIDWSISGEVSRTNDAFGGTYAAKLITLDQGFGPEPAALFQSFTPSQTTVDTLIGWYKYTPKGTGDSASVEISLFGSVPGPGVTLTKGLGAAATYTQFKLPITGVTSTTAGAFLSIQSSMWSGAPADSSTLFVDSLVIKPGTVGIKDVATKAGVRVYPNPANDVLKIAIDKKAASDVSIVVYNSVGTKVYADKLTNHTGEATIPVKQLASGIYIYEVNVDGAEYKGRFMKD